MINMSLEAVEVDMLLNLINLKIDKINSKEIDEHQLELRKQYEDLRDHIMWYLS